MSQPSLWISALYFALACILLISAIKIEIFDPPRKQG